MTFVFYSTIIIIILSNKKRYGVSHMMNSEEKSLPEKLSDDIVNYILKEKLQPGDRLPNESVLAEKLGAGRSSIREAMKLLASRNIVTIRQGSGTYISSSPGVVDDPLGFTFIGDKQKLACDLLEIRFLLEPSIAARAASYSGKDEIKHIQKLCDEVEQLLEDLTKSVLRQETIDTHREITEAIAAHDSTRAYDAMYLHLVYNRRLINFLKK